MESLATWKHGYEPNGVTYDMLERGMSALDAVEQGARYCEADITCMSVGRGGIPDELGEVTLDASIMDDEGNCGSVAFVRSYLHPISIARKVMERTKHVMLAGEGAEKFAADNGLLKEELLTDAARVLYEKWRSLPDNVNVRLRRSGETGDEYVFEYNDESKTQIHRHTLINDSHDTIGIIARDRNGRFAGACTTSGLAFKKHGRVGDSPIIGAGLFAAAGIGVAVATGNGELVMRGCSTFHIIEQIRQGTEPDRALENALNRIRMDKHLTEEMQVGFLVLRSDGTWSARGLRNGFQFTVKTDSMKNTLFNAHERSYSITLV
jgi:N4-(beta-N-acetylglucosaminyl)-L-asparaginase